MTPTNTSTPRKTNIEILRLLLMFIIVGHHYALYSGFDYATLPWSVNKLFLLFILMGGKIGVDTFVLISGYHLCEKKWGVRGGI